MTAASIAPFGRHVLSASQFDRGALEHLFATSREMRDIVSSRGGCDVLRGRLLATLFYEPSTRTASSFNAAMQRLGGGVIPVHAAESSVVKGETLEDTVRTLASYVDVIALRHPEVGSAARAARVLDIPLINAGDGAGEHPTQALLDLFTIIEELGHIDGLTITFVGDLKHGRTVHSLAQLLTCFDVSLRFVSPEALALPTSVTRRLDDEAITHGACSFEEALPRSDVLYVTRVQKERFADPADYDAVKGSYILTPALMQRAQQHTIVMHPLPRIDELSHDLDADPRAVYFRQMRYGLFVRMALLATLLRSNSPSA